MQQLQVPFFLDYYYFAALGVILLLGLLYFIYFMRQKHRLFQNLSLKKQIHNIVTISLFSAIATAILIFFSRINNITLIPAVRVAFEGVLVKISGFIFGPIVGLISALVTELTVILFIPTYFHYNYLLVLMAFGFFAGLIKVFRQNYLTDFWAIIALYLGIIFFICFTIWFFVSNLNDHQYSQFNFHAWMQKFKAKYLFETAIDFNTFLFWINMMIFLFLLIMVSIVFFTKTKRNFFFKTIVEERSSIIGVLCLTVFAEYLISVSIATKANSTVFGETTNNYRMLFISAASIAPVKIFINSVIILSVYRIMISYKPNLKFTH